MISLYQSMSNLCWHALIWSSTGTCFGITHEFIITLRRVQVNYIILFHDGSVTQTKHKGQLNAQAAISNFYTELYSHNPCDDNLEDIEEFLEGVDHETVSKE